jgi:small subunit ribosomal protein S9
MADEPQDQERSEEPQGEEEQQQPEAIEEAPAEEQAPAEEPQPDDPAPAADAPVADGEDEGAAEMPAETPAAEAEEAEPEAVEEEPEPEVEEAPAKEKKKDVIPGADLEPIAVEPEARPLSAEEKARKEAEEEERRAREAALAGESEEEQATSRAPAKIEGDSRYLATGKRKHAIARVTLLPGGGSFVINGRPIEEFFPRPLHQTTARQPLATTGYEGSVDVRVRVHGGGISGQAGAVRHGIARALTEVDPELRGELKRRGFLTRDARAKERRKAGLKKARKRPQFSKR